MSVPADPATDNPGPCLTREALLWAVISAVVAGALSAVLAVMQLGVGHALELTRLNGAFDSEFWGGAPVTLLLWWCALAPPVTIAVIARWVPRPWERLLTVPAAMIGVLVAAPLAEALAGPSYQERLDSAVVVGAVLGGVVALLTALLPVVGWGVAAHAVSVWLVAALALLLGASPWMYAGQVSVAEWRVHVAGLSGAGFPGRLGLHIEDSLIVAVILTVLCGLLAAVVARARRSWWRGALAGVIGPALALLTYLVDGDRLVGANADAFVMAALLTLVALPVTVVGAGLGAVMGVQRIAAR